MSPSARRTVSLAALAVGAAVAVRAGRRTQLAWGATRAECDAALPGDGVVREADLVATRATTVDAAPAEVWPWVVQIGQGRGGFYSYDRLENLAGCRIRSADRVEPAWQALAVDDEVHLHPDLALRVALVEPGRALVLAGVAPTDDAGPMPFDFTWAFVLEPADDGGTRLLVRERYGYRVPWAGRMVEPLSWLSFVMTGRMLRGIRARAERAVAPIA